MCRETNTRQRCGIGVVLNSAMSRPRSRSVSSSHRGRGIKKDRAGAAKLFEAAAKKGHPQAHYNLGLLFLTGDGKPENPHRAFLHLRFAAQQGLAAAQYDLAALYQRGHGVDPNAYEAARWLRTAAASGLAVAQYEYAVALLSGRGFNADRPRVLDYLKAAAKSGFAGAQNRLAHIYAAGGIVTCRLDGSGDVAPDRPTIGVETDRR